MSIDAESRDAQLRHVGPPDDHRAGPLQPRHHRRVDIRAGPNPENLRTRKRRLTRDIERVLDRDRNSQERRRGPIGAPTHIGDLGALAGVFQVDAREHPRAFAVGRGRRIERLVDERTAA
jgi:hypothetical protein